MKKKKSCCQLLPIKKGKSVAHKSVVCLWYSLQVISIKARVWRDAAVSCNRFSWLISHFVAKD